MQQLVRYTSTRRGAFTSMSSTYDSVSLLITGDIFNTAAESPYSIEAGSKVRRLAVLV